MLVKPKVLVTGASGFIGQAVCRALIDAGYSVTGQIFRRTAPVGVDPVRINLLADTLELDGSNFVAVIHLAALAHTPSTQDSHDRLWRLNVATTEALALQSAHIGAQFVFISTTKVLGENGAWSDDASPAPENGYAQAKFAAESLIVNVPNLKFTILRPPLVYGPGVGGNFLRLLQLANTGWPLPLASLHNLRSLLYVRNLAAAIVACIGNASAAAGGVWLVADDQPMSVAVLLRHLAKELGRPARLFHTSPELILKISAIIGAADMARKLTETCTLNDQGIRSHLGWHPPYSSLDGLRDTVSWYRTCEK
jgi:nucleoside-diphosphate-sugar epimerase